MYPSPESPYYGIFVKEQIDSIAKLFSDIQVEVFFINGKKGGLQYLMSIFTINYKLLSEKYDLIHIHYGLSGLFLLFNPFVKTPVAVTFHGGDIQKEQNKPIQNYVSRAVARRSSLSIILNDNMRNIAEKLSTKTVRIPCGVDTDIFTSGIITHDKSVYTVVFPGDITRVVKNYHLFQKVIELTEEKLERKIKTIELKGMTRSEVAEVLQNSDALLMTSISEGSPQVIKEAMACSTPVVSTDVGDVSVLLEGVNNCHVLKSSAPEDLSNVLVEILKSNNRSLNSRDVIFHKSLDQKSIAKSVYKHYYNLSKNVSDPPGNPPA